MTAHHSIDQHVAVVALEPDAGTAGQRAALDALATLSDAAFAVSCDEGSGRVWRGGGVVLTQGPKEAPNVDLFSTMLALSDLLLAQPAAPLFIVVGGSYAKPTSAERMAFATALGRFVLVRPHPADAAAPAGRDFIPYPCPIQIPSKARERGWLIACLMGAAMATWRADALRNGAMQRWYGLRDATLREDRLARAWPSSRHSSRPSPPRL